MFSLRDKMVRLDCLSFASQDGQIVWLICCRSGWLDVVALSFVQISRNVFLTPHR